MNRAERLKLKYAIIVNITGDSKLANKAKHWGEIKIYKELNIYIGDYIKTRKSKLKPYTNNYRKRLLKSADNKYNYAVKHGVSEENAEILKYQTYKAIDLQIKYQMFFKSKHKRFTNTEKNLRKNEWKVWSEEDIYPPMLVHQARQINLKNNLDINDSYGFGIMFYYFTTNKSIASLQEQFKVDLNTGRIIYPTVSRLR
ncbi:MAG: hypothetical protein QXI16_02230 [Sulfolobaceae archaeon]